MKRSNSGITEFDELIEGGFPESSIIGLRGPPGVGKSIFCLHFLLEGARKGQKCVYVNIEEPMSNIENMISQFEFAHEFMDYVKKEKIIIRCYSYTEFENIYLDLFSRIRDTEINRLVVDSFNVFFTSLVLIKDESSELSVNKKIYRTISMLRKEKMISLLILEKSSDNANIPYLVDGMVDLDFLDLGTIERRLFISKMRWTNQYKESVPFDISETGITLNGGS